jgi:acetyl esterase
MPLDAELATYLEAQKRLPPRSALTLGETRARMVDAARIYAGEPVELGSFRNLTIAGLNARLYSAGDGPLVVYFHGGRFISGNLESHDPLCRRIAAAANCRVVGVDYRLAPEHPFPAAVEDAVAVVEWALGQSERVAVAGDSSGANLAAVVAGDFRARLRCQALIYPMLDATCGSASHREFGEGFGPSSADMRRGWELYIPEGADPRNPRISPNFAQNLEGMPPAYVLTAEYDTLRDEGEEYAHRLGLAGNRVELKRWPGAIHGFFALPGLARISREAIEEMGSFIRRTA